MNKPEIPELDEGVVEIALADSVQYDFYELMQMLIEIPDLIVTVPEDQVDALKAGMTSRKAKDNQKLRASNISPDNNVLTFTKYPAKDKVTGKEIPGFSCVRIKLAARKGITVIAVERPDDAL